MKAPPFLVLATRNRGKIREFQRLLGKLGIRLRSLEEFPGVPEPLEGGRSYEENAREKALLAARATGLPALADDSGLEVDALGGEPGLRSARYSGGSSRENIELLLARLRSVPREKRTARFRCVVVVAKPDGSALVAEGSCEGIVLDAPRGEGGFGYDPVFLDPESGKTFAEMSPEEKDRKSHRGRALRELREKLPGFLRDDAPVGGCEGG